MSLEEERRCKEELQVTRKIPVSFSFDFFRSNLKMIGAPVVSVVVCGAAEVSSETDDEGPAHPEAVFHHSALGGRFFEVKTSQPSIPFCRVR